MCERDTKEHFKPKGMIVVALNVGVDNSVEISMKMLSTREANDKIFKELIRIVEQEPENSSKNIMVQNGILYSKDSHKYP